MPARLPIVALTAFAMKGDRDRCLAVGMDDYLAKPIRRDQLAAVLARFTGDAPAWPEPPSPAGARRGRGARLRRRRPGSC